MKLNTDGARDTHVNASCGGIIKEDEREQLISFSKHIGICDSYTSKLRGIYEGLKLA